MSYLALFSVLYALFFAFCYGTVFREPATGPLQQKNRLPQAAVLGLFLLFVVQLVLSGRSPGHVQDTSLFRAWTAFANDHSIREYYTTTLYVDYPPVYLYILYVIGKLTALLDVAPASPMYLVCIRSVPILFDGLSALLVYRLAEQKLGQKKALAAAFLCAVNPARILNSSVWGQVDSVTTLLTAVMLLLLYKKKYVASCSLLALLFLTKPQMIMFAPLLGFVFFFDILAVWHQAKKRNCLLLQLVYSLGAMVLILLLVPLPATGGNYMLLIERYKSALNLYPYATLNAANLYGMMGANWAFDSEEILFLSYKTWGFVFISLISVLVGFVSWKIRDRRKIFVLGVLMVLGIYMLGHGMHERYSFPALFLLMLLYVFTGDRRQLLFYGGFSLTTFIICGQVLGLNQESAFIYGDNLFFIALSAVNVILFILWMLYTVRFAARGQEPKQAKRHDTQNSFELQPTAKTARFVRLDYILMLALTVFYAFFGFYHLGSLTVPESGWYAEDAKEAVVLDLGELVPARQLYVYSGWIDRRRTDYEVLRKLQVETSDDGMHWEMQEPLVLDTVFMWQVYRELPEFCRYVRLTCDDGRFYLNEAAFFGETENERYPVSAVISDNSTAICLTDEPDKVVYEFSWYETTYFDEIYHPRTAYEFMTHRYPYENTHPPLGKVIIACGMLIFGVNPFGWRFFGTLCGVLMVPLAYVMGKKMLKKTEYAFMAAFLMSFDFMHLAQTRLATIDSYTAFFVMGMYLFMFLYIEKNFYHTGVKKTLPPLFASGVCFGLGAATKWQGVYAGLGLAVLFFYSLYRRYAEYRLALKHPEKPGAEKVIQNFWPMAIKTVLAGFGFFVAVPAVIYFLSYIPAMMSESTGLNFFFTNQSSMFNYHANLEAQHSYGSSWWQWPFDYKPLYAYNPNRDFVPKGISMGITSFGNPAIWWMTIPVVVWNIWKLRGGRKDPDLGLLTAVVGFFSLYVPWIFVKRTAFIYHFFPCVMFVVLMLSFFFRAQESQDKRWKYGKWVYMVLVFVLFVAFYPVLTGMAVPTAYVRLLRWIPGWVLG